MIPTVIFDIDGTLADCEHRRHFVTQQPKNWPKFFEAMSDDPPRKEIVALHRMVQAQGTSIVYCTGRPEPYREQTEAWLRKHVDVGPTTWPLLMRPANDTRPDNVVKLEMLHHLRSQGRHIVFAVDDRQSVVDMWRANGVVVLQCAPGDFDPITLYTPKPGETLLYLMVGPSGAGKSTHILRNVPNLYSLCDVISSDRVRAQLTGNFTDQSKNAEAFAYIKERVTLNMRCGVPTLIDATHLRRKDRMEHVSLAPEGTTVEYIVVDRPLEDKLRDGEWRLGVTFPQKDGTTINLVEKHHQTFKSTERDIMKGDSLPNVRVHDYRQK